MKPIFTLALILAASMCMAQTDTINTSKIDTSKFHGVDAHGNFFALNSGQTLSVWTYDLKTLYVSTTGRHPWSVDKIDSKGNAVIHIKRSMIRWINDSTAYISTYIHKPVKKKKKHFLRMADGSFYLKELKPGETATLSIPIKIQ